MRLGASLHSSANAKTGTVGFNTITNFCLAEFIMASTATAVEICRGRRIIDNFNKE